MSRLVARHGHARIVTGINVDLVVELVRAMDRPRSDDPWALRPEDYRRRLEELLAEIPVSDLRGHAAQATALADRLAEQQRRAGHGAVYSSRFD